MHKIPIIWDFDGTLTPIDSTTQAIEVLKKGSSYKFWNTIKELTDSTEEPAMEHILASDTPAWIYSLSRLAFAKQIP